MFPLNKKYRTSPTLLLSCALALPLLCYPLAHLAHKGTSSLDALFLIAFLTPCLYLLNHIFPSMISVKVAAKKGIFFKNLEVLTKIPATQTVFLNKTGTLTEGEPRVVNLFEDESHHDDIHQAICALEAKSEHPAARALLKYFGQKKAPHTKVENFQEIEGFGVQGKVQGEIWKIQQASQSTNNLNTIDIICGTQIVARAFLQDKIRSDAKDLLPALACRELVLFSGDHQSTCEQIGASLGIDRDHIYAEKTPERKAELLRHYPTQTLVVGDGESDTLALASGDIGVAMYGSAASVLKNASVFFSRPGLHSLVDLIELAETNRKIMKQNFAYSSIYFLGLLVLVAAGDFSLVLTALLVLAGLATISLSTILRIEIGLANRSAASLGVAKIHH